MKKENMKFCQIPADLEIWALKYIYYMVSESIVVNSMFSLLQAVPHAFSLLPIKTVFSFLYLTSYFIVFQLLKEVQVLNWGFFSIVRV